ncbi:MAG: toll/interleukin-1 receptor domain-containing protein [Anaerolineae bacterium]|nr:toll/interleukin-1 receptor domain-containing protein [Anaerolineae bacterium]
MTADKRSLKVFLCHAHADRDSVRALPEGTRLTTPALAGGAREDGVDAWLDKENLLPGQGFDRLNLPDWELEIRKAV